jgi:hypothetical protein
MSHKIDPFMTTAARTSNPSNKTVLRLSLNTVAYLLKARTVEPEKQPLLGNVRRNNRGIVMIRYVTRATVAMGRLGKHVSAETNSRNNRRDSFLCGPCPGGYKRTKKIVKSVEFRDASLPG